MGKEVSILLFLGIFSLCFTATSLNESSTDKLSLLALKAHINSDILTKNWSEETSFCTWIGINCSRRRPRVIGLDLSNMSLRGTIAREIGNFSFLTFLNVSNNRINGLIPGEIGNLRRLRVLDMSLNHLTDHIPQSFGFLRRLEYLSLSDNELSGDIPKSLSACVELNMLDLSSNNLTGSIPVELGNLSRLQELILWRNQLIGELPSSIFNISSMLEIDVAYNHMSGNIQKHPPEKLESLSLSRNQFEGEILSTLMSCHSLRDLVLTDNKFTGNIPSELGNLSAVQVFDVARNEFAGTVPPSVGNLSNLWLFEIVENSFHGSIPSEIGQLSSLTWLNLESNKLNGEVPQSIFNLSSLQTISLLSNNLSGSLPSSLGIGLPNIEYFSLGRNKFHGKIPNSISNLSRLAFLELDNNYFTGEIPITLGNLGQLQKLFLANNQLTNNLSSPEQDFLSSLTTCNYLEVISVASNDISGVLPKSLGSSNLSASLQQFDASSCKIISPIPNELGNLSTLIQLSLQYNDLTGAIPVALGRLRKLQKLEINGNELQGSISSVLCSLNNLYSINLAENSFFGKLPRCLGNLSLLREINLTRNAFNSSIPSIFWLNKGVTKVHFSDNFLDGSLSRDIGNMKSLVELDLSRNQLSGEIPNTISQLQNLINLSLSNNKLDGPITESFAFLKDLQHLDLSHNNLSGPIPKSFEALANLNYFNVSFNELNGEIPFGGPFVNFTADSFMGNKGLCGAPQFKVEACKRSTSTPSSKNKLLKYILPAIALVVVATFVLILVLRRRRIESLPSLLSDLPPGLMHERISYYEILRATSNLDEENLIGRGSFGSVYRGNFSDAMVAAVKVFNLDVQGSLKSFDTECRIMSSIRHRNLVKVITSCSNLDFKALVMEYMPNGNLEKWLYSADCSLNIFQRLGIMIDVASALEYLHEGYTSPIVHCDLKPNNILLDEDMVAHVGDFGIAKLLTEEQRIRQTKTLGTIGYMAPEYGSEGLVSTMVDVYSYGILLVETFSRRKATDELFSGELTMKKWASESFLNSVMQIVDHELLKMDDESTGDRHESCFISIIGLALDCMADAPKERPKMKDVLVRIKNIRLDLSNSKLGRQPKRNQYV